MPILLNPPLWLSADRRDRRVVPQSLRLAGLWQPFEFMLFWRNDPLFRAINRLQPLDLPKHLASGLPVLVIGWPLV
jgi:hypothetical protein